MHATLACATFALSKLYDAPEPISSRKFCSPACQEVLDAPFILHVARDALTRRKIVSWRRSRARVRRPALYSAKSDTYLAPFVVVFPSP